MLGDCLFRSLEWVASMMKTETRKAVVFLLFLSPLVLFVGPAFYGLSNDESPGVRKFRPVKMAKTQSVALSVKAEPPLSIASEIAVRKEPEVAVGRFASSDSKKASELGWAYFERQKWGRAQDWFLTALEWDSANADSAKGLVMSLYFSGETADAYQVGQQLGSAMPVVKTVVPDAVSDEVKAMLKSSNVEAAKKLLKKFPSTDPLIAAIAVDVNKATQINPGTMASANRQRLVPDVPSVVEFVEKSGPKGSR